MVMHNRPRQTAMSQINVVPFIDVVLVLLIIFMVTAPMLQMGQIELPKVGQASSVNKRPVEVRLKANDTWALRGPGIKQEEKFASPEELINRLKELPVSGEEAAPVVLAADKSVQYGQVVELLDRLKRENIPQVGLLLQMESNH